MSERGKRWTLTEERALEIYELLQNSMNTQNWDVYVLSLQEKVPMDDFMKRCQAMMSRNNPEVPFRPSIVAQDCMHYLRAFDDVLERLRHRMEDAFRSLLVVNEDMNKYLETMEDETLQLKEDVKYANDRITELERENEELRNQLKYKENGIHPVKRIVEVRMSQILELMDAMKKASTDDKQFKKYAVIIQEEVDHMASLVTQRQEQLFSGPIDFDGEERDDYIHKDTNTNYAEERVETVSQPATATPVNAVETIKEQPSKEEPIEVPDEYAEYPQQYIEAVKSLERIKEKMLEQGGKPLYDATLKGRINNLIQGKSVS